MIETHNLTKTYKPTGLFSNFQKITPTTAIYKINLRIERGQIFGLLGLNGAGKTTLVKILATLLEPTSGTANIEGLDVIQNANQIRKIVNMIAGGERMLYWRLTGRENLSYFADLYDVDAREKKRRIDKLLSLVGLTQSADKPVEVYSKGMKQRLQIARGLINDPQYIFMDEPTLGLDVPIAREIRQVIKELGKTILFTSHYIFEAEELCNEVAIIDNGKIIEQGTPGQLKLKYNRDNIVSVTVREWNNELSQLLQAFASQHKAIISNESVENGHRITIKTEQIVISELMIALTTLGQDLIEIRAGESSLEDVLITILQEQVQQ